MYDHQKYIEENKQTIKPQSDWRLPTIEELLSVVDYTKIDPAAKISGFHSSRYWSSTKDSTKKYAWYLHFSLGRSDYGIRGLSSNVRCVRMHNGTLEWQPTPSTIAMTWYEAVDYASNLNKVTKC